MQRLKKEIQKFSNANVCLWTGILSLLLLISFSVFEKPLLARGKKSKNIREHNLFPSFSVGSLTISDDEQLEAGHYTGYILGAGAGYNITMEKFSLDLRIGWATTSVDIDAGEELKNSQPQEVPSVIETSFGEAEIATRLRITPPLEIGMSLLIPFGVDTTFAPQEDPDQSPNVFLGPDFLIAPSGNGENMIDSLRYGIQFFIDTNLSERNVIIARASIGYSFPVIATPRYKTRIKEKVRTKKIIKYKTKFKKKVVTKYKNNFLIDAGIIYFETGKSELGALSMSYLRALADFLKKNSRLWEVLMITSHTDKRGSDELNEKLSRNRNKAISKIFVQRGISLARLKLSSLANKNPVEEGSSPLELARNRRVEITISGPGSMSKLKGRILLLKQRYKLPTTCEGVECR